MKTLTLTTCLCLVQFCMSGMASAEVLTELWSARSPFSRTRGDNLGVSVHTNGALVIAGAPNFDPHGVSLSRKNEGAAMLYDAATGAHHQILVGSGAGQVHGFGSSVSLSGNMAFVGAPNRPTSTAGSVGQVVAFDVSNPSVAGAVTRIDPTVAAAGLNFGRSLDSDGSRLVVGATRAAFVYDPSTLTETASIAASSAAASSAFGSKIAVSGDRVIVGDSNDATRGANAGAAFIFDATTGQQLGELVSVNTSAEDLFGSSVDIFGDFAVVGARRGGIAGGSGTGHVFDISDPSNPTELLSISSPLGPGIGDGAWQDEFGWSVALNGDSFIIGALGNGLTENLTGEAYRYSLATGELVETISSSSNHSERFAAAMSLDGEFLAVGAPFNDNLQRSAGRISAFQLTAVPEPGSVAFLAMGAAVCAIRRRRKNRTNCFH